MKKLIAFVLMLALLTAGASAEVITALATELNPEHLALVSAYARVTGYDAEAKLLTVELIVPEVFARADVEALKPGDGIYTDGEEVKIWSVTREEGCVVLNEGPEPFSEGSVWLFENLDGNYEPMLYDDRIWMTAAELQLPVSEHLIFLDEIDPETDDFIEMPTVHSAEDFLNMLVSESQGDDGPGFSANNVMVAFDADEQLAVITRYFVP